MDAVTYLKESNRMCWSFHHCHDCPLWEDMCINDVEVSEGIEEKVVAIVEQWSEEHPIITNGAKFKEVFGAYVCERPWERKGWLEAEYKDPRRIYA